jgi:hypothetical protein
MRCLKINFLTNKFFRTESLILRQKLIFQIKNSIFKQKLKFSHNSFFDSNFHIKIQFFKLCYLKITEDNFTERRESKAKVIARFQSLF